MHILILSCNTGGGHNSAAAAVAESLADRGHSCERVDFLALAGKNISDAVSGAYISMVQKVPAVFGMTYGMGRAVSTAEHAFGIHSPVYSACALVIPELEKYIRIHPCDAIVAPHTFPALAITEMKRRGIQLPLTIAVATDYTCTPFFEEEDCDYTMVPSKLCIDEFARRGIPRNKLIPFGIPVSAGFRRKCGRLKSCTMVDLDPDKRWILIMGGSMGAGHIQQLTSDLLHLTDSSIHIAVICGSNKKLYNRMLRKFARRPRVKIIAVTNMVARFMEACDILYTKPGGITSTEAAVMGIPIVHMKPIPGCESRNRRMFMDNGMSISARSVMMQALKGCRLLDKPKERANMIRSQRQQIAADSALKIASFIEAHARRKNL